MIIDRRVCLPRADALHASAQYLIGALTEPRPVLENMPIAGFTLKDAPQNLVLGKPQPIPLVP